MSTQPLVSTVPASELQPAARGAGAAGVAQWHFGPFVLDQAARELRRGTVVVKTTHKMFDLLSLLLRQRHRVVPHAELIRSVWPRVHVSPGVLPQMVRKLRLVLDEGLDAPHAGWIQGARGVGYRFVGVVHEQVQLAAGQDALAVAPDLAPGPVQALAGPLPVASPARPVQGVPPGGRDQMLYELGRDQIRRDDLTGLASTIAALRKPDFSASSHRRCLVWADIFESHLERLSGNSRSAWHHVESAHLMLEGLDEPHLQCELHSVRGLYFETFTSEAEALAEFENAWALAQEVDDLRLRAGCAARLAFAFGRTNNWPAFEQWSKSSLQLAAQCGSRLIWLRHTVAAAMGWMEMGHGLHAAGRLDEARRAWSKSLRLNESVLGEPEDADVSDRTRRIAQVNRLALLARLQPERVMDSVAGLQVCLADEPRPGGRIQLMQELAVLLHGAGRPADAEALCRSGLAACQAHGIHECRDDLLALAADIATAQGDLAGANAALRELLQWRRQQAAEQAQRLAAITAVRLDTERALALAEADREQVHALTLENAALRRRAAMLEGAAEPDGLTGLASPVRFERHLAHAWAAAQARNVPLCVALVAIDQWARLAGEPGSARHDQLQRDTARLLLDICRGADMVAPLSQGDAFGVVFDAVGLARALAVCQRIRKALHTDIHQGGAEKSASVVVADVSRQPELAAAMKALRAALDDVQRQGGNRVSQFGPLAGR